MQEDGEEEDKGEDRADEVYSGRCQGWQLEEDLFLGERDSGRECKIHEVIDSEPGVLKGGDLEAFNCCDESLDEVCCLESGLLCR